MGRTDLTEAQWRALAPHLPPDPPNGQSWSDHRKVINGILWRLRTGASWRDIPEQYEPWQTCYDRFVRWGRDGTWLRILQALQAEADARVTGEAMAAPYDLLLGRKTYEIFAAHWPHTTDAPAADSLNRAHKYVASRTLERAGWGPATLIRDVPAEVAELKAQYGAEIQVHGSSDLLRMLLEHDLVDEFRVWTFPVLVGDGKRLFGSRAAPGNLEPVDSTVSTTGVVIATYRRAGAIAYGSFALEEPTAAEVERRERLGA